MAEDLLDHWVGLITSIFPSNAWIVSRYSGNDHIIQIDWKLTNDLQQKNRRSKKIQITIKEEAIDDYLDKDERARVQTPTEATEQRENHLKKKKKKGMQKCQNGFIGVVQQDPDHRIGTVK